MTANSRALVSTFALFAMAGVAVAQTTVVTPEPVRLDGVVIPSSLPIAHPEAVQGTLRLIPNQFPDASEIPGSGRIDFSWPRPGGSLILALDESTGGNVSLTPDAFPAIDTRFDAPYDGGVAPPDPNICVGRNHVVSILNLLIGFHNKAGALVGGPYSISTFFGMPSTFSPFDPLAIYDPFADRYILMTDSDDGAAKDSRFWIAFSQTNDPTGAWNKYSLPVYTGQGTNWADYPSGGLDRLAVYYTANMFSRGGGFANVTVFIVNKEDGYAGRALTSKFLIDVRTASNGSPFRLRPAYVPQVTPNDEFYFVHLDPSFGSVINLFRLTGSRFGSPQLVASTVALSGMYFPIGKGRQPGGAPGVDTLGCNAWNAYYRNGSLWTAQAVNGTQALAAWVHKLNVATDPATREKTWQVEATNIDSYFPYVLPKPDTDDFALLTAFSGASQFVTGRYWNVSSTGTVRAAELVATNSVFRNDSGRHGDYFSISTDPRDRNRIWLDAQYMRSGTFAGNTGIASVRFEDIPVPSAPSPVPDGSWIPGQEVKLTKASGGQVTVTWDRLKCPAAGNHLVWFDLNRMSGYQVKAETCAIGTSGTWTGAPPAGNVSVLVVSDDNSRTEGAHGRDSSGRERPSTSTQCGLVQKLDYGTCGP